MKKKNFLTIVANFLFVVVAVFGMSVMFTSCGDDDDDNGGKSKNSATINGKEYAVKSIVVDANAYEYGRTHVIIQMGSTSNGANGATLDFDVNTENALKGIKLTGDNPMNAHGMKKANQDADDWWLWLQVGEQEIFCGEPEGEKAKKGTLIVKRTENKSNPSQPIMKIQLKDFEYVDPNGGNQITMDFSYEGQAILMSRQ